MTCTKFSIGFPTNIFSETIHLFPKNYLIDLRNVLEHIHGGHVENPHFQLAREVPEIGSKGHDELISYVKMLKEKGIDSTAHAFFLFDKTPQNKLKGYEKGDNRFYFNFDFSWLVVPKEFKEKPVVGDSIYAREADINDVKKTIDLVAQSGINVLTTHVTKPGVFLSGGDWGRYCDKIGELLGYISKNNYNIDLAVETGGITKIQLLNLKKIYGSQRLKFNLDTAHLVLDEMELMKREGVENIEAKLPEINRDVRDFFTSNTDIIKVCHLTQTALYADLHLGILEDGILSCNEEIIHLCSEQVKKGNKIYCMVESEATLEDIGIARMIIDNEKIPEITKREGGKDLIVVMGNSNTGKSSTAKTIEESLEGYKRYATDDIREMYAREAFSFVNVVPEDVKEIVYDEMHRQARNRLDNGYSAIIEGTYHIRNRRDNLKNMIEETDVNNVYIVHTICEDDKEIKKRIGKRKQTLSDSVNDGGHLPLHLADFNIWEKVYKDNGEAVRYTEFRKAHIIKYDTANNNITLMNADEKSRSIAETLKKENEKKYNVNIKIIEY